MRAPSPQAAALCENLRRAISAVAVDLRVVRTTPEQQAAGAEQYARVTQEIKDSGKLLGSNRLTPVASSTTVRVRDGKRVVTDGPFVETKEQLGGYFLIEAKDLDEAIAISARCPG